MDEAYQYLLNKGESGIDNIHDYFTNNQDTNPPALEYDASSSLAREFDWTDQNMDINHLRFHYLRILINLILVPRVIQIYCQTKINLQVEKLDNYAKAQLGKLMDNLQKIGKFVGLCNLIKNFRDMTDAEKLWNYSVS